MNALVRCGSVDGNMGMSAVASVLQSRMPHDVQAEQWLDG